MNTNRDQVVSLILKYLLHLLSIAGFYFVLFYSITSFWLHQLLVKFSKVAYISTPTFHDQIIHLLIIYCLFCYFANNFVLDLYRKEHTKQFIISFIIDMLIIPIGLLIMVIYNNLTAKSHPVLDVSVYNIYLITVLILAKEIIANIILSRKAQTGKKLNYKTK